MKKVELKKTIEVLDCYDVIVCGAGPSGICAAVATTRQGLKVALIERYGVVGGNLTVGHVGPILGEVGKGTIRDEVVKLLEVPGNDMIGRVGKAHNFEDAKRVLAEFLNYEGVEVYLQTTVIDVIKQGARINDLVLYGGGLVFALESKIIIDCTGDGNVASLSGCEIQKGRKDGLMQPVTLEFTLGGVDEEEGIICIGDADDVKLSGKNFHDSCKGFVKKGLLPELLASVRLHPTTESGQRQVNTTQVNGIDMTDVRQIFKADLELRGQILTLLNFFKKNLPGYEHCYIISSGATTGVRETRRVIGDYVLTSQDVCEGKKFEDVVVHNADFVIDIHNPEGAGQAEEEMRYAKPYDIPYRCFVPKSIDNIFVAGRCISGTHSAHASYRVMSICMAMGEAVGLAASVCIKNNTIPRNQSVAEIQKLMGDMGIDLYS